jgi:hypothetical protein
MPPTVVLSLWSENIDLFERACGFDLLVEFSKIIGVASQGLLEDLLLLSGRILVEFSGDFVAKVSE